MTKYLLKVKNVVKNYGDYIALENANISVPKGSIYALLGPNGAGKTTLMRIINQITGPDSGSVFFNNDSWDLCMEVIELKLKSFNIFLL